MLLGHIPNDHHDEDDTEGQVIGPDKEKEVQQPPRDLIRVRLPQLAHDMHQDTQSLRDHEAEDEEQTEERHIR